MKMLWLGKKKFIFYRWKKKTGKKSNPRFFSPTLDIRQKTLDFALDLVNPRNIDEVVMYRVARER
jgi:hypothetical protein